MLEQVLRKSFFSHFERRDFSLKLEWIREFLFFRACSKIFRVFQLSLYNKFRAYLYYIPTMKKQIFITVLCLTVLLFPYITEAWTWKDSLIDISETIERETPKSYEYISLNFQRVPTNSQIELALKKLVYHDVIENASVALPFSQEISKEFENAIKRKITTLNQENKTLHIELWNTQSQTQLSEKERVFYDVLNTLQDSHVYKDEFSQDDLLDAAITGLTEWTDDSYTTYFPPARSTTLYQSLDGEYEWVWAYVEMPEPGVIIVVSPIVWWPAEEVWIKGGDRVTHVDGQEITEDISLQEAVSWIKWPSGTRVELTVLRGEEELVFSVVRQKIVLKDVEHEKLSSDTYYIQIKNFGDSVDTEFQEALSVISDDRSVDRIIFDLRNNPGGYLHKASSVLSYFLDEWSPAAVIRAGDEETRYISAWYDLIDFEDYELIFLQNSWSASASEIMIGTVKDYFPDAIVIGEQSFWKWSVQTLRPYRDGSTLKYTSAKWYTGKSNTGIDGVWIIPDIELLFDRERWETYKKDNQLERALEY